MGMSDLPDVHAQSPRVAGLRAEGIHIRQITSAHVTTNTYVTPSHDQQAVLKLRVELNCSNYIYSVA